MWFGGGGGGGGGALWRYSEARVKGFRLHLMIVHSIYVGMH